MVKQVISDKAIDVSLYIFPAAMQANAMGLNPQLNVANMVAMQGRANTMFSQGTFTPSPTTVSSRLQEMYEAIPHSVWFIL